MAASILLAGCGRKNLPPPLIGLITDYGVNDAYVAQLKGSIYSTNPNAQVVDLVGNIEALNTREAAYLVDQAAAAFPGRVIFVVVVDAGAGPKHPPVVLRTKEKKYYVAPNNGVLSFVASREGVEKAWLLDKPEFYRPGSEGAVFQGPDVIGPVAARLAAGAKPEELGTETKAIETIPVNPPHSAGQTVGGEIVHIDGYGNLITNIPLKFAPWLVEGNQIKINLGKETINAPIVDSPGEVGVGRYLVMYNAQGRLQILVNKGSAARLLNAQVGDGFTVHP